MEQFYEFSDWTSASRMKNVKDPSIKIDVAVMRSRDESSKELEIDGYQITVYNLKTNRTLYCFYVDFGTEGTWSLSTDEAVKVLNQIGFPCEFNKSHIEVSDKVKDILSHLVGLGYSHICRQSTPAEVYVLRDLSSSEGRALSDICSYRYHDFWFVDTTILPISSILNRGE